MTEQKIAANQPPVYGVTHVGIIMMFLGVLVAFIGYAQLMSAIEDLTSSYARYTAANNVRLYSFVLLLGTVSANVGFFVMMFGWISSKIDNTKAAILKHVAQS